MEEEKIDLTPIHTFLLDNIADRRSRCYMPGHKGTESPADITEIEGADSLYESYHPTGELGIIGKSEKIATQLFGTAQTFYSASGSTLAIQTMLATAKLFGGEKDHIVAGRYSHRSFISSCIHLGLTPSWVYPKDYLGADISPEEVEERISDRTLAVFVTAIDYYGRMADIKGISEVCKKHGIPLLVDNAHGAYLKFLKKGMHPTELGATMCADSAHKTLPVLTGGAYLHIMDKKYVASAKDMMALFGTTSPSYLILDSLDRCNATLIANSRHIQTLCGKISYLRKVANECGLKTAASDPMRIVLDCLAMKTTGIEIAKHLRQLGVECEYADSYRCVLLFGWSTPDEDLHRLREIFEGLRGIDVSVNYAPASFPPHIHVPALMSPSKAIYRRRCKMDTRSAVNKVCAGIIAPCPPGIPLIMPGEVITADAADTLLRSDVFDVDVVM